MTDHDIATGWATIHVSTICRLPSFNSNAHNFEGRITYVHGEAYVRCIQNNVDYLLTPDPEEFKSLPTNDYKLNFFDFAECSRSANHIVLRYENAVSSRFVNAIDNSVMIPGWVYRGLYLGNNINNVKPIWSTTSQHDALRSATFDDTGKVITVSSFEYVSSEDSPDGLGVWNLMQYHLEDEHQNWKVLARGERLYSYPTLSNKKLFFGAYMNNDDSNENGIYYFAIPNLTPVPVIVDNIPKTDARCSPDNNKIAYNANGKLMLFDLISGESTCLFDHESKYIHVDYSPISWSPCGTQIAFSIYDRLKHVKDVFAININSKELFQVTTLGSCNCPSWSIAAPTQ